MRKVGQTMPRKKVDPQKYKADKNNEFYVEIFKIFLSKLPRDFVLFNSNKVIPYHTCRMILCSYRYTQEQVKFITKKWAELGLIIPVKFRGFRINQEFMKGELNE